MNVKNYVFSNCIINAIACFSQTDLTMYHPDAFKKYMLLSPIITLGFNCLLWSSLRKFKQVSNARQRNWRWRSGRSSINVLNQKPSFGTIGKLVLIQSVTLYFVE